MGLGSVAVIVAIVIIFAALAAFAVLRLKGRRGPRSVNQRRHGRSRPRTLLAAAAVAPGAVILGWGVSSVLSEGQSFGLVLGWVPGLLLAGMASALAYLMVKTAPRTYRTRLAIAIVILVNAAYLAIVLAYVIWRE